MNVDTDSLRRRIIETNREDSKSVLAGKTSVVGDVSNSAEVSPSPYTAQNFAWIAAAIGVSYFTNFVGTILHDATVYRSWLYIGFFMFGVHVSICAYLVGYLSLYCKMTSDDWDQQYPLAIPLATACAVFGCICLVIALWPVWSFLTPLILFVILMGIIVSIAMLPAFK